MPSFNVGDMVVVTTYGGDPDSEYSGKVGPIKKILDQNVGQVSYFIDIGVPGMIFWDLICYEGEFEHVKEETNE